MSEPSTTQAHTGPIKNPKQLLIAGLLSFIVPIFAIIALVAFVASGNRPSEGAADPEGGVEFRIQKVGSVEVRDANRPLKSGEDVYKAQCIACHGSGAAGAPKFMDVAAWSPRIKTGYDALLHSALTGKGAMSPQGGGDFNDTEIGRAVVYMANAAGAKFDVPNAPTQPAAIASDPVDAGAAAPVPSPLAMSPEKASATSVDAASTTAPPSKVTPETATKVASGGAGESLYKQACQVCHATGIAGAPKFGNKEAWVPRIATGKEALYKAAINGLGAMPPRGGTTASDADIQAAVDYMAAAAQ